MSGEHSTPVGTPVVIAPGKIFLVGEYAVVEEGSAVQAAVTRYAKAQFVPHTQAMQPLVSEIVRRIRTELGDVSTALPPGSVFVNTDDFRLGGQIGGLGCNAAIAVASVGAVLESLGLAIEPRKRQIFSIADTGRRATQRNVGSGADTAAATYGGLIRITRPKGGAIRIEPLAAPSCLQLVLFSAGASVSPHLIVDGVQRYAKRNPLNFSRAMDKLRESAQVFIDQVTGGRAERAVAAAGLYGEELQKICSAAGVPIMTSAFGRAASLAREFGGIAKPTGAGGGEVGVALFATPEAALWFRRSCTQPLVSLDGGMDNLGVRCRVFEKDVEIDLTDDPGATPSPEPDTTVGPPRSFSIELDEEIEAAPTKTDVLSTDDVEAAPTKTDLHDVDVIEAAPTKTDLHPTDHLDASPTTTDLHLAGDTEVRPTSIDPQEPLGQLDGVARFEPEVRLKPMPFLRRRTVIKAVALLVAVIAAGLALIAMIGRQGDSSVPGLPPELPDALALQAASAPPRADAAASPKRTAAPEGESPSLREMPFKPVPSARTNVASSGKRWPKGSSGNGAASLPTPTSDELAAPAESAKPQPSRAGRLSTDDF